MKRTIVWVVLVGLAVWSGTTGDPPAAEALTPMPAAPSSVALTTARATDRFATAKGPLVVTPLNHASLLFGWDGRAIYVDPTSTAILDEKLPLADVIVVTEARFDHLDGTAVRRLSRPGTVVVGPAAVAEAARVDVVAGPGVRQEVGGTGITLVPPNGYILDFGGTRVYVSGDTRCPRDRAALGSLDVAFVSVREPTSMSHAEAVECAEALRPRVVFPYHDRGEDLGDLEKALSPEGIDVRLRGFHARRDYWRLLAMKACSEGRWGNCRDDLDNARLLDPRIESDPAVVRARAQVRAWEWPFPPWW